jgi:type I restriction enzyme, S subunit
MSQTGENKIPKGWRVQKLGNLTVKIGSGSTPRGGEVVYKTTGIPLIRSMNIHFSGFKRVFRK